jgi:hypothetical protein
MCSQQLGAAAPSAYINGRGSVDDARLLLKPEQYTQCYNRVPFGFEHNLHTLDLFHFDSMRELCGTVSPKPDAYFITGNAPNSGAAFFSSALNTLKPSDAIEQLDERSLRILIKRPEEHDDRFRNLLHHIAQQVLALPGGASQERIVRLESAILISSAATTTPIHFDPEMGFFCQIEGEKLYHAYEPDDVSEHQLETFYRMGKTTIGKLEMSDRNPLKEHTFQLLPGKGFHQPQNAPHWVETRLSRSISYTCVFETNVTRALGRTRAFNYHQRQLGLLPSSPGVKPSLDRLKAVTILPEILSRKLARRVMDRMRP